jgi:1,4-dihydroxy-2-naphthoate octaprenyltransferase
MIETAPLPSRLAVWLLAARPRTLPAAAAPVLVGTALASWRGMARPLPALAALAGALLIQVATNLANDYFDFVRGADTTDRIGPTRVTQAGLLPPSAVRRGMLVTLAAALSVGAYLVVVGGWPILVIGIASLACAVLYTGGPFPLAYHGLGEVFVFVFFGLVAVAGTYWVQALSFPAEAWWAGAGAGALSTALLVVNNLRDLETDARAGKRTLAVRLGRRGTALEYLALLALAAAVPLVGIRAFGWPPASGAALLGVVAALPAARTVLRFADPRELLPALGQTARALLVWAVGLSLGLVW